MSESKVEQTVRRLKFERDRADRRYNDALTQLDEIERAPVAVPDPEAPLDELKLPALNESFNIISAEPELNGGGIKGKLAAFIWRMIGPYLQRQLQFNATVVEHLNRDSEARRAAHRREREAFAAIRTQLQQTSVFQAQLMLLLQQITPYVDTRDRDATSAVHVVNHALSGLAELDAKYRESADLRAHRLELRADAIEHAHRGATAAVKAHDQAILGFNGAMSALADTCDRYRESIENRARRFEDRTASIAATHDELRDVMAGFSAAVSGFADAHSKYREFFEARAYRLEARTREIESAQDEVRSIVTINQQAVSALKRGLQESPSGQRQTPADPTADSPPTAAAGAAFVNPLDAYKYLGFEEQFRGSQHEIRERQESYVGLFTGVPGDVLDVGCGRGEFVELLNQHGITARGIDINAEMVEACRARGLNVVHADAVSYLSSLPPASLGGIVAAQVVEHLEPAYLLAFLERAFDRLAPGGRLLLETINPACWTAFFESYIRDVTHRWPLHPETLKYLTLASGFTRAEIEFKSPMPPEDRLQPVAVVAGAEPALRELVEAFNANVEKLNARMFTHMDYAIVADKR